MIKLCYKEYPFKITLGACKDFFDKTGKDLPSVLIKYIESNAKSHGFDAISKMSALYDTCSFLDASYAMHVMIKVENSSIPLEEIQDGMFKVSWLPREGGDNKSEPWPLVMLDIATQVNDYFNQEMPVKKKGTKG